MGQKHEHEHVEGDPVEGSRPVFRSNAEILNCLNDKGKGTGKWPEPSVDMDAYFRSVRNALFHGTDKTKWKQFAKWYATAHPDQTAGFQIIGKKDPSRGEAITRWRQRERWRFRVARILNRWQVSNSVVDAGSWLLPVSRVVFGRRAHDEVFAQIVADMREEILDAQVRGATVESWFARLRGTFAWGRAVAAKFPLDLIVTLAGLARRLITRA